MGCFIAIGLAFLVLLLYSFLAVDVGGPAAAFFMIVIGLSLCIGNIEKYKKEATVDKHIETLKEKQRKKNNH